LATWASALVSLWFRLVEHWFPDTVINPYAGSFRAMITWQMASILVALPIYLFVMRVLLRELQATPDRIESGVHKWLTYIALLLAVPAVVCSLFLFVYFFMKGELSLRFVLKCAIVLAICGSIFCYYLDFPQARARHGIFAGAGVAGAVAAVACGILVAGTPSV